jgi:hypothetical protein
VWEAPAPAYMSMSLSRERLRDVLAVGLLVYMGKLWEGLEGVTLRERGVAMKLREDVEAIAPETSGDE